MKVLIAVHHFPPNHIGGAEWQAYRIAHYLKNEGNDARVICVESDTCGQDGRLRYTDDFYNGIPVRRLSFNLPLSPDPFRWSFRNPIISEHLKNYIEEFVPDIFHLIGGYLISGSVIPVIKKAGIPVIIMPMDFWFLCPRITLLKPDNIVCEVPDDMIECLICLYQDKRRYRWMTRMTKGISNDLLSKLWKSSTITKWMGKYEMLLSLNERRRYLREVFCTADFAISNSNFLRNILVKHGFQSSRFEQIRQGIDVERLDIPIDKKHSPNLRIGYIGQIAKHKGVDVLVKAFKRLITEKLPTELLVYGDIMQFPSFVRDLYRIIDGDERIKMAGTFSNEQVSSIFEEIDVLVVPSVWYENSPNVVLEAFATGTPVVASDQGGLSELVQNTENGLLFKTGSVIDLTAKLQMILDRPVLLDSLRKGIKPPKAISDEMYEIEKSYHSLIIRNE